MVLIVFYETLFICNKLLFKNLFENRMLIFIVFLHMIVLLKRTHEMTSLCGISRTNIKKTQKHFGKIL